MLSIVFFSFLVPPTMASKFESIRFRIEQGKVNFLPRQRTKNNIYTIEDVKGQKAWERYLGEGFLLEKKGEIQGSEALSVSLSSNRFEFPPLPILKLQRSSADLIVSCGLDRSFRVFLIEEYPLRSLTGKTIPDTSCDTAQSPCSSTLARVWKKDAKAGFGYQVQGAGTPNDFRDASSFRPFPNLNRGEKPVAVASRFSCNTPSKTTVTAQFIPDAESWNVSFENIIRLLVIPSY